MPGSSPEKPYDMIILQGICYDEKSSFLKGARKAPALIREFLHSDSSNSFTELGLDITTLKIKDQGDFKPSDYFEIEKVTRTNVSKKTKLITLGGDHSITYPILRAYSKTHGPFDILQIDAHGDLYDTFEGDPHSHACPFARIMEERLASHLIQVGGRTYTQHQWEQVKKFQVEVHEMKDYNPDHLSFKNPLYISLDMDSFDPAFAPGVSHHEPGGFTARQVIDLVHSINVPIMGADIVEYNPDRDIQGITEALAAKMLKEIMGKMTKD